MIKKEYWFFSCLCMTLLTENSLAENDYLNKKSSNDSWSSLVKLKDESRPLIREQSWHLTTHAIQNILAAKVNQEIRVSHFPSSVIRLNGENSDTNNQADITLTRYELMAPDAKIWLVSGQGKQALPTFDLMAFSSIEHGVGLLVNRQTADVTGIINQAGVTLDISGNLQTGLDFRNHNADKEKTANSQQCHTSIQDQPGDPLADVKKALGSKSLELKMGSVDYETVVAVDTDTEWMAGKGNSTTVAMNYIAGLFVGMNVFYERDIALRLLIGDVFLRTTTDPYPTESNIINYLTDFGEYWRVNNSAVNRDFAMMLSGQITPDFFSGIAWINQYCETGFLVNGGTETAGSYSVNRIGTNLSVGFTSQFVAHELGHNLGSPHTHCYSPEVDTCFSGESMKCYNGSVSCPVGGKGTIMSYCHFDTSNGGPDCGLNDEEFHPTVIGLLETQVLANFPSCIQALGSEVIFANGFE